MKYKNITPIILKGGPLALAIVAITGTTHAANIAMSAGDAAGASSFSAGTNWTGGAAPSAGNTYSVGQDRLLRTPADASTSLTFLGDSLTLSGNGAIGDGRLLYKGTGTAAFQTTANITNLILNGGSIENAANTNGSTINIAGGVVNVTAASSIMRQSMNGPVVITSTLTGNGMLTLGGQNDNGASVTFNGLNTYTGNIVVTNGSGAGLILGATGSLAFAIGQSGINNNITGTGAGSATFNGAFVFDLTNAATILGSSWNIVGAASINETYAGTFVVRDQTGATWNQINDVWTSGSGTYQFSEASGILSVIPEPSALLLGALGLMTACGRRRRLD